MMRSTTLLWPEKPSSSSSSPSPSSQKRVIGELIHGRDLALQLQTLLRHKNNNNNAAGEIAGEILRTFTESISALTSAVFEEVVCDDGGSEDSISSNNNNNNNKKRSPISKDGRGCYKRRKDTQTWIEVAPTVEDAFSWRKYGQKEILNAKFPRCYFRCSHKPDQGCRATKQVQKMEDDPKMYHITYIGHHTCKKTLKTPQIIPDSDPCESYESQVKAPHHQLNNRLETINLPSVKQELNKLLEPNVPTTLFGPSSSSMFAEDVMVGHDIISLDNSNLDDINDLVINFVGFDYGDFSFDEAADHTATMFSYSNNVDFL